MAAPVCDRRRRCRRRAGHRGSPGRCRSGSRRGARRCSRWPARRARPRLPRSPGEFRPVAAATPATDRVVAASTAPTASARFCQTITKTMIGSPPVLCLPRGPGAARWPRAPRAGPRGQLSPVTLGGAQRLPAHVFTPLTLCSNDCREPFNIPEQHTLPILAGLHRLWRSGDFALFTGTYALRTPAPAGALPELPANAKDGLPGRCGAPARRRPRAPHSGAHMLLAADSSRMASRRAPFSGATSAPRPWPSRSRGRPPPPPPTARCGMWPPAAPHHGPRANKSCSSVK